MVPIRCDPGSRDAGIPLMVFLFVVLTILGGCTMNESMFREVEPRKTTYVHAEGIDGGKIDLPPRVLKEVVPRLSEGEDLSVDTVRVVVKFVVGTDGRVGEVVISESSDGRLDQPAIDAIRRWRFEPARRDREAIESRATVLLRFDPAVGTP